MSCVYCIEAQKNGFSICLVKNSYFTCTRKKGHKGNHIACGTRDHKIYVWRKSKKELK